MKVIVNQAEHDRDNAAAHEAIARVADKRKIESCSCQESMMLRQTLVKIMQICTHDTGVNALADIVHISEIIDHMNGDLQVPIKDI